MACECCCQLVFFFFLILPLNSEERPCSVVQPDSRAGSYPDLI